ncbi:hypothetical protein Taro_045858 [Colocasia esculenta]|uniref:Uncharacterized protein n=1 Tax=Colocasia esculenta TaxID=4460 RepID=A0A843WY07_COLES|nr:hypothetical protein [Colocasia esculenta]
MLVLVSWDSGLMWLLRDSLSQEFIAGQSWWRLVCHALPVLFEFIAYLTGLNSNPSGSSDPWVAAQPLGSLAGGPGGPVVTVVASFPAGSKCELQESVATVAGCACFECGCCFARAAVGFVFGLHVRVGVSRRLREPTCGVTFTGAGLLPVDPGGGGCLLASLIELSRCLVCRVAPLVERCDTCLWLLPALCWLVVNSGEVLSEFFSVGSSGGEATIVLLLWFEVCRLVGLHSGEVLPEQLLAFLVELFFAVTR